MVQEMAGLGFEYIELSHGVRITLVDGIIKAVNDGLANTTSVHNFCPLPPHVNYAAPNLFEPTALDDRERAQWNRYTMRTLEFASQVGASHVILHSGSIRFWFSDPGKKLELYQKSYSPQELKERPDYTRMLEKLLKKLGKKAPKYMAHLTASFQEIIPFAKEKGLKLCIENRESISELPLDQDMPSFLGQFDDQVVGYWHDSGHAQIKDRMAVINHEQALLENQSRLFGFHLHDVSEEGKDHQPPGSGVINFPLIKSFIQPEHLIVMELSPSVEKEQLIASRNFLLNLLEEKVPDNTIG